MTPKNSEKASFIVVRNLGHARSGSAATTGGSGVRVAASSSFVGSIPIVMTTCSDLAVGLECLKESCETEGEGEGGFVGMAIGNSTRAQQAAACRWKRGV